MAKKKTTKKKTTRKRAASTESKREGRRPDGKFAKGNTLGRGNPQWARLAEYRKATKDAVSPADLKAVMRKLTALAKAGDLGAAKVLLDRAIGKVEKAPANPDHDLVFPTLASTKDTVAATNAILAALGDGRLDPASAAQYAAVVELARRSLETHELAERIAALEAGS